MKKLRQKAPIVFTVVLFAIALIAAAILVVIFQMAGESIELSTGLSRITVAIILLVLYARLFQPKKSFSGLKIMLPVLLFAVFNIANHYLTGGTQLGEISLTALVLALAPGMFEETIFRGISIPSLREKYKSSVAVMLISAVIFSLVHLTNLVGQSLMLVAVQLVNAVVIGMVFAAVYIRSGDLVSLIIAHAAIDLTSTVFPGEANTPIIGFVLFFLLLAVEITYAFILIKKVPKPAENADDPENMGI